MVYVWSTPRSSLCSRKHRPICLSNNIRSMRLMHRAKPRYEGRMRRYQQLKCRAQIEGKQGTDSQVDVLLAYGVLGGTLIAGNLPILTQFSATTFPYFTLLAVSAVYIGSKRGLMNEEMELISIKQGAAAPLFLSFSLFGVYILTKLEISLETFISSYFFFLEALSGGISLAIPLGLIGKMMNEKALVDLDLSWLVQDLKSTEKVQTVAIKPSILIASVSGIVLAILDRIILHDNFTINNLEACFIVTTWLELLGVNSFRTAVTLLFGLLFYDVFWVFGSSNVLNMASQIYGSNGLLPKNGSVMADVAMSPLIEAPTKLEFPKSNLDISSFKYSILGLGDILVPGLLVGLLLRFDDKNDNPSDAPYFKTSLSAYGIGLLASFLAAYISRQGQPALLYLVPLTVGTAFSVGYQKGELGDLWNFQAKKESKIKD